MTVIAALSGGTIAALAVLLVLNLFAIAFGLSFLRANRAARAAATGEPPAKPVKALSRRDFFRGSLLTSLMVFGAEFGAGTLVFLWPSLREGFGATIPAGTLEDVRAEITDGGGVAYVGTGRFYVVRWDGRATEEADYEQAGLVAEGFMALYQKCVHLGCRVPFCGSSQWFECPCHGSKYNSAGEYELGPAPRGMDRFQVSVSEGVLLVDTSAVILGPPRGADTISQPPQGPFCVATE
jgi:cytochrome b6-f complex iron-sulfur subunit